MSEPVTDPKLLALLNAPDEPKEVTDPALLAMLNGDQPSDAKPASISDHIANIRQALDGATRALENGLSFGLADRARAGMDAATGAGGYGENLKAEQAATQKFRADHPVLDPVIESVGSIAAPLGAIGAASKGASLGAKTLLGGGAGAAIGGVQGAAESPDWTDPAQVAKDAVRGGIVGGITGAAIPGVGKLIGTGANAVTNFVRGKADGISRAATNHLVSALEADTPAAVQAQIDRLGPDATLADTGPAMLGKAQGASLNSDEGRSILQKTLTDRNNGTNARITGDVNAALGPAEDPQTVTNAIRARRTEVDNQAYPAALDNAPEVQTAPILRQLDNMIPRSVGMERTALTRMRDMMMTTENRPLLDAQGIQQYDHLGNPRFQEAPVSQNDAEVLHKVKQELDNVIQYDAPGLGVPAGALTRQQGALKVMRTQLNNTLEAQVPGYAAANRASAALARRGDAVEAGTQYLGSGKTTPSPDRFAAEFDPLSQGEKIAFAKGSRGNIDRVLGTKANDLQALRSELQGEGGWNTAKIAAVHGQDAADQLMSSVDRNLKFRDTYNKVVENSQTAQRQAAAKAMKPDASVEPKFFNPNSTVTGNALAYGKKTLGAIGQAMFERNPTKSFGEIAKVLTAQGLDRDVYHSALVDALSRRHANDAVGSKAGERAALMGAIAVNAWLENSRRKTPR